MLYPIQWVLKIKEGSRLSWLCIAPALHSPYLLGVCPAKLLKLLPKARVWVGDGSGGLDGIKHFLPAKSSHRHHIGDHYGGTSRYTCKARSGTTPGFRKVPVPSISPPYQGPGLLQELLHVVP